jgi:hypothetical protein
MAYARGRCHEGSECARRAVRYHAVHPFGMWQCRLEKTISRRRMPAPRSVAARGTRITADGSRSSRRRPESGADAGRCVCLVRLANCVQAAKKDFEWELSNPIALKERVEIPGWLGLFDVTDLLPAWVTDRPVHRSAVPHVLPAPPRGRGLWLRRIAATRTEKSSRL